MARKPPQPKQIAALSHPEAKRTNIPTAEYQSVMEKAQKAPVKVSYPRKGLKDEKEGRNRDLDPQLVWRGKDQQDWSDLVVAAPPLYIQEKVSPKVLVDDLLAESKRGEPAQGGTADLFGDFNGLPVGADKTDFYHYEGNWQNRMILGDSLQVMASLAEREGLRGKVQCIYLDPPYGIKFNSNFQWSTTSRDVKDGNSDHITREPEQVKAFRDTWRDGIHSYLTYLRDRLTVARDLLTESGSIFVQIGDENVHRVRAVMDEVFGDENFVVQITVVKTSGLAAAARIPASTDYILWYARNQPTIKYRPLLKSKNLTGDEGVNFRYVRDDAGVPLRVTGNSELSPNTAYRIVDLTKPGPGAKYAFLFEGRSYESGARWWGTTTENLTRVRKAGRVARVGNGIGFLRAWRDYDATPLDNVWADTGTGGFLEPKIYVVQTIQKIIQRCVLMTTDPGDLVLDPTCGSGTTAYVAEQWGRRWITLDTSRVALALARARIMGARYPYYLLADSKEGQLKEAEVARSVPKSTPTYGNIGLGFVYERVPHITLKSIANNAEIDVIWEKWQNVLEPLREKLNKLAETHWQEWEIPREIEPHIPTWLTGGFQQRVTAELVDRPKRVVEIKRIHHDWWQARIARQKEIDASIAAKAEFENLYDKPYEDKKKVRVAGPFTVESLSPHRMLGVDEHGDVIDGVREPASGYVHDFAAMILENLKTAGVQQAHKDGRIAFTSLVPWPGDLVCAEGRYLEGAKERRAAIFIGPEFGTVSRPDLVQAAREAGDADFDVLIACAFAYEAHATEFEKLGRIPVLKARMNADLHMADDLKNTGKGNLFVIFGEPDIDIEDANGKSLKRIVDGHEVYTVSDGADIRVKVNGVDVFKPQTGEVVSDGPDGIACWFVDTDYNEESFFVRQAYFLGANDPYKSLKTTLKAEINADAWETLHSDTSRPFPKPATGRIAVKVINHLGDEVMKVFKVE